MEVDAEKLIVLIEARPPLYNYQLKDHHNRDLIDKLWEEIAVDMKAPGIKLHFFFDICLFYYFLNNKKWHILGPSGVHVCLKKLVFFPNYLYKRVPIKKNGV